MTSTSTSTSAAPAKPKKKPSPYRIPKLDAFSAAFASLSARGWRVAPADDSAAPAPALAPAPEGTLQIDDPLQLERKRLVRSFRFPAGEYARLLGMAARVGQLVEELDVSSAPKRR